MKLSAQINQELPFVIYKKPNSGRLHIWQQTTSGLYTDEDLKTPGFYFTPFSTDQNPSVVFPETHKKEQDFLIREFETGQKNQIHPVVTDQILADMHQEKVVKAIALIKQGNLDKMIVSRKQRIDFDAFFSFDALLRLMQHYDESFVYMWHHPKIGTWIGATPELLVSIAHDKLQTMALAGTLPVQKGEPVIWSAKEIKEQQIVTDYIARKLSDFSDRINVGIPQTVYQGKLAHIKTMLTAVVQPKNMVKIIKQLHPTPAVCGLPTGLAKKYIAEIESYNRKYYTGFLGIIGKEQVDLYVNLRSMEVHAGHLDLYVGGGIVIDSVPEKEWQETCIKSHVLLSIL